MRIIRNCVLIFMIALTYACEKDDDQGVGSMDLEVTVGLDLVELKWKRPVREVNIDVSYDLYLNDVLVEAKKLNPGYELEDLPLDTSYVFKVIGDIDGVVYTDEITFSTINTENFNLLLKSIGTSGGSEIRYNDAAKVISVTRGSLYTRFEYDNDNRLTKQIDQFYDGSRLTEIAYTGNRFETIYSENGGIDFVERREFEFSGTNNYTIAVRQANDSGDPPITFTETVSLTRNAQGEIGTFKLFRDGSIADNMEFTYANGNLVKLEDLIENKTYDIMYDTKKSYVTYTAYFSTTISTSGMPISRLAAGVSWPSTNLYRKLINVPELFLRQNKNNVLNLKVNGILDFSYSYDYKGSEYPFSITYSNGVTKKLIYFFEEK